ncbi:MAG: class I SAM-dependent methyltransferase [Alphaproteobacteria bacterium]|nr:class I SAM-dependent methyltransferase [Alphaproteobacteria bacterium]
MRIASGLYQIQNICLGGVATTTRDTEEEFEVGQTLPITIQQSGIPIFESTASVCRVEKSIFGSKTAFKFVDSFIDFDELLNRNLRAQIATRTPNPKTADLVPHDYRVLCADVLKLLRGYDSILAPDKSRDFVGRVDDNAAFDACVDLLIEHWRSLWLTGNDIVRTVMDDHDRREATKEFTELVLTPEMRRGAIWDRSYAKPLGYPGDFEIMNQVYDWNRVGGRAYEMLVHRIGLEVAECIKTRMEVVLGHVAAVAERDQNDRPARILSLGSGPAREVELYLTSSAAENGRADFTLIDQERRALRYAHEKTYPSIIRLGGRHSVRALNISFTDVLRGISAMSSLPEQDLIYSVGLLDYLTDRRAAGLAKRLYDMLAPGGMLIIGNMNETPLSNLWPMEFITDWTLYYRDEATMLAWADGLQAARSWTTTDPTGRVRLLHVLKRGGR